MKIAYDEKSRGLLIAFGDPSLYRDSREVVPGVVVDFDDKGKPLAIELEDAGVVTDTAVLLKMVTPHITRGSDLREFRESLGMTQQQLGDALGIPRNTIARWERDELEIEKSRLLSLALRGLTSGSDSSIPKRVKAASQKSAAHTYVAGQGPLRATRSASSGRFVMKDRYSDSPRRPSAKEGRSSRSASKKR